MHKIMLHTSLAMALSTLAFCSNHSCEVPQEWFDVIQNKKSSIKKSPNLDLSPRPSTKANPPIQKVTAPKISKTYTIDELIKRDDLELEINDKNPFDVSVEIIAHSLSSLDGLAQLILDEGYNLDCITQLDFDHNSLTQFWHPDLARMKNLRTISFRYNRLIYIPQTRRASSIVRTWKKTTIDLSHNRINMAAVLDWARDFPNLHITTDLLANQSDDID